jgi:hypothetical protein
MARARKLEPMVIHLDSEVKAALQELDDDDDERTLSAYVNSVLRHHIDAMRRRSKAKSGDK